jgi:hypothetical protein
MVFAGPGNAVIPAAVRPLAYLLSPRESPLDHGYIFPQGIHLDHFLDIISKGLVILLDILVILSHAIEVELIALLMPEELLLYLILY